MNNRKYDPNDYAGSLKLFMIEAYDAYDKGNYDELKHVTFEIGKICDSSPNTFIKNYDSAHNKISDLEIRNFMNYFISLKSECAQRLQLV